MTHSSDSWGDMRDQQPLDPFLTDLLAELRSWGTGEAPVPSPALAVLLDAADQVDPVPAPRRRKNMFVAKLAGLGVFAKVALGVGVAAAAVTTAGASGVLPAPAQHGVATIVNAVSPLDIPDGPVELGVKVQADVDADVTIPTTTLPGGDGTGDGDGDDPGDDSGDDDAKLNHGTCVSTVAKDKSLSGREHGQAVSAIAQSDCGKEGEPTTTVPPVSTTTTSTTVPEGDAGLSQGGSADSGPGHSGDHGNGNSNGNPNGNPGKGNGS